MRYILILLVFILASCHRVQNTISIARLDCGSEVTWSGSYLRFIDATGRLLESNSLSIRSLDDNRVAVPAVTSKGCIVADSPGLWMIRHSEKLEALVLRIEDKPQSGVLQLQDVSRETLAPVCPGSHLSTAIDSSDMVVNDALHDKRGYQLRIKVQSQSLTEAREWPWINLAGAGAYLVGSVIKEGEAVLEIELRNEFRLGEISKQTCSVKFDYSSELTYAAVQKTVPRQYRSKPFYALNAEKDLNFVSESQDVAFHEVCVGARQDWNQGAIQDHDLPICEKSQIVDFGENLVFPERRGFWQIQYRSIDKAGNRSAWSSSIVVLLEQVSKSQEIKTKAANIASVVEFKPIDGAAGAMVASLELYNLWLTLPTRFERDQLENIVLLSFHRPWFRDTIKQDLIFQPTNNERYITAAFLDDGTKVLSFQRKVSDPQNRYHELRIYDLKTKTSRSLTRIDWMVWGGREFIHVSEDQKKFIFGLATTDKIWVGQLIDNDVLIEEVKMPDSSAGEEETYWTAVFTNNDQNIVVTTTAEKLIYNVSQLQDMPLKEPNVLVDVLDSEEPISPEGTHVLIRDYDTGIMTWTPISDESLPKEVIDLSQFIPISNLKHFDVLAPDQYLVVYSSQRVGPCVYAILSKLPDDSMSLQRLTDGAPCLDTLKMAPELGRAIMNDSVDGVSTLILNNLSRFSTRIQKPDGPIPLSEVVDYHIPGFRAQTKDGKLIAFEFKGSDSMDSDLIIWERAENAHYREIFRSEFGFFYNDRPLHFAEDLGLVAGAMGTYIIVQGYLPDTKNISFKKHGVRCDIRAAAYLGKGKLAVSCIEGMIDFYDISQPDVPFLGSFVPKNNGTSWVLLHDQINNLLIAGFGGEAGDLYVWPNADIYGTPFLAEVFRSGIGQIALSIDSRYLAVASAAREEMKMKVFEIHDLDAEPLVLEGHNSRINKMDFFGSNSLLVSGSDKGILKIWDVEHPDFPGVSVPMQKGGSVLNLTGVRGKNEFIVENDWEEIYHYKLDSMDEIRKKTCDFLKPYMTQASILTDSQKQLCNTR